MAAECGVAAVVIVGVQPDGKLVAALGVAGVKTGVGPFVSQGAVKSLHFSVGLRPVRPRSAVLDTLERIFEGVGSVTGTVVRQYFSNDDAALGEPRVCPVPECGGGLLRSSLSSSL